MKIKEGFFLHRVDGENIVIAVGKASAGFHGVIKLNDTCADIWRAFEDGKSEAEAVNMLTEKYDVDKEKATADVSRVAGILRQNGIIE